MAPGASLAPLRFKVGKSFLAFAIFSPFHQEALKSAPLAARVIKS